MDFETFLLFLGGAIELLTNLVVMPLSLINLYLVARTSVIHTNMKFILLFQSFVLLIRSICRFVICLFKFILWDPISAELVNFFPALAVVNFIGIFSRNFVPHILIIERILATLYVRSYEKCRGYLFTMIWSPIALTVSIYIAFTSPPKCVPPLPTLITTILQWVVGSVEFAVFYQLCRYNFKSYQKMLQNEGTHSLSVRYQLSENIRIGKQLIPPLLLNLCNILSGATMISWYYFALPHLYLIQTLGSDLNAFFGLFIELFIITCHPFLKRDLCQILHRFGTMVGLRHIYNNGRVNDVTTVTVGTNDSLASPAVGIAQRDLISGKALIDHSNPEEHFAMLEDAWNRPIKPNK